MIKRIINCETGEVIDRELNAEELAQMEIDKVNYLAAKTIADAEVEAKAAQRQALLDRLGITSEEAKILLGA